ncbi:ATP-binding cassette domain-containing protein [Carnobacterium sp. ISL-102]|uniref:ABC transporter ATP-binding protein n=1 Tax=Carnobacterium sp. ISL-102 TaxID=2819142 RepID=UPI001BEC2F46|nr:ATP-binding cassette domain-containing protein [Carnobacterium sp. ISL-102]MBT2731397.1 ATP-binding cassette domain-containing protein [Carnobacterium sp. ISL-102]
MSSTPVLILKGITKQFNKGTANQNTVLNQLSLEVEKGDFLTIIGGNGAGKSTLLNSIAGNFMIDQGTIMLENRDLTTLKEEKRAGFIGRVFQDPVMGTAPRMTVGENLAIAYRRGKKRSLRKGTTDKEREYFKNSLLELGLGLENRLDSEMGLLSGGQRQSIALLMATMNKPELLLLDEHTAALDPKTAKIVLEITQKRIEQEELTALMITHNMNDALKYGNRLIMLDAGQVIVDISGEEKKNLTVADVLVLFQTATDEENGAGQLPDELLLSR